MNNEPVIIDVRPIPRQERHPLIFSQLESLAPGQTLVVVNNHNPIPLRNQVAENYPGQYKSEYLEEGPTLYRLAFTRLAAPNT